MAANSFIKLYDTFHQMILSMPYNEIKIIDLVKQASVNRNTFYYHFLDMDCFLEEYLNDCIFTEIQKHIVRNEFSEGYNLLTDYVIANKDVFRNILNNTEGYKLVEHILHTRFRMDIQKKLYDYETQMRIKVPREFMEYFSHSVAEEYFRAITHQLDTESSNPELMKKAFAIYAQDMSTRLVKVARLNLK